MLTTSQCGCELQFTFQSKSLAFLFDYFDSTLSCQSLSNFHSCWLLPVRQNCGSILGVSWSLRDKAFVFSRWSKDTSTNLVTLKITAWLRCKRKYALAAIRRFHPCVAHLLEFSVFFLWSFCPLYSPGVARKARTPRGGALPVGGIGPCNLQHRLCRKLHCGTMQYSRAHYV